MPAVDTEFDLGRRYGVNPTPGTNEPGAASCRCRVSVIVPAYNASAFLGECLAALTTQTVARESYEVIVVDDVSTDRTVEVAEALGVRVIRARENAGPAHARNLGAWGASGEILFFVDADVVVRPDAIERVLGVLDGRRGVTAVFGSYDDRPRARGLLTEYRNLLHHYTHQTGQSDASTFWTGCGAVGRDAFLNLGGFDVNEHPRCVEDIEFGYRLRSAGYRIALDRDLQCTHLKRWTLRTWLSTDVFGRAIPWAKLILSRSRVPGDLNIRASQKLSVGLTGGGLALSALAWVEPWLLAGGALAMVSALLINVPLFRFLRGTRGLPFAVACAPLHLSYFSYGGASFGIVWVCARLGITVPDGNTPPASRAGRLGWLRTALTAGAGTWWAVAALHHSRGGVSDDRRPDDVPVA